MNYKNNKNLIMKKQKIFKQINKIYKNKYINKMKLLINKNNKLQIVKMNLNQIWNKKMNIRKIWKKWKIKLQKFLLNIKINYNNYKIN